MAQIIRKSEVCRITGLSASTIDRREREGDFPRRRRLGRSSVGWIADEIDAWISARPLVEGLVDSPGVGTPHDKFVPSLTEGAR